MIIWGWLSRFTVLGVKLDECLACGGVCEHVIGRKTSWGHAFWIPIFPYQVAHLMLCSTCGAETKLSRREVSRAMQTGLLHLDRHRPNAPAILEAEAARAAETGRRRRTRSSCSSSSWTTRSAVRGTCTCAPTRSS